MPTPPAADLQPNTEPRLDLNVVANDSGKALDDFDVAHEAWGRGEHGKVVRLCWWYKDLKVLPDWVDCGPRPPER